ncbi:MAG: FAD-dependent monooxygenase [Phreatobacter sp.]|uniref:FAD-dependent monooxygenase n=1 Tax=Phreatobacter sp. TaxID=1966341 RepID=UPI001A52BB87|nr:FAD-dependent monooxygenase [Phreatobacter sp.]MBL8567493.1 FAD-dependent monooxygenase [Phreatobacter sp.]
MGRIAIVGAGIGGLTAALTLAREGFSVEVLERAPALEEVGAGIQLGPNASRILIRLGLAERLAAVVVVPEGMDVRSGRSGDIILSAELGDAVAARYGAPWWVVHRGDLQAALGEAACEDQCIQLRTGAAVSAVTEVAGGVEVKTGNGDHLVDALIGADGVRSAVRRALGDGSGPVFRGRTAWRATLPMDDAPRSLRGRRLGLWLGPNAHVVHYPLRGGAAVNVVAFVEDDAPVDGWSGPGEAADLLSRFAGWAGPLRDLLAAAPGWTRWSLADRPVWFGPGRGAATLLGDAAHAMLPFAAQGGAMAIEDAAVLARLAAGRRADLAGAFRAYERARRGRTAAVQQLAARNGAIYHLTGPMAFARDTAMRLMGGERLVARQDWIYRFGA